MTENELKINLDPESGELLAQQLRRQFLWLIASGKYQPGDCLPSVRNLAEQLSINLHTVRAAYQRLESDGVVHTKQGYGTEVLKLDPERLVALAGRSRSHTIGVILPGLADPVFHAFLHGVEQVVHSRDLMILVCDAHDDPQLYFRYFSQLAARNVDGIIISSFDLQGYLGGKPLARLPMVTVDWPGCQSPSINFDNKDAARQAVDHLVAHGHTRIGLITFGPVAANVQAANAGYLESLRAAGIPPEENLIARMPSFLTPSGARGVRQLMALEQPPTAIFTIGDMLALDALKALKDDGFRVPEDVALTSLNDIPSARLVDPPLTTVGLPAEELGFEAGRMLIKLMDGEALSEFQVTLPVELVIRQSCGCGG